MFLHEDISKKKHEIDYLGALLMTFMISSLMFILMEGGSRFAWDSWQALSLFAFCALTFIVPANKDDEASPIVKPVASKLFPQTFFFFPKTIPPSCKTMNIQNLLLLKCTILGKN